MVPAKRKAPVKKKSATIVHDNKSDTGEDDDQDTESPRKRPRTADEEALHLAKLSQQAADKARKLAEQAQAAVDRSRNATAAATDTLSILERRRIIGKSGSSGKKSGSAPKGKKQAARPRGRPANAVASSSRMQLPPASRSLKEIDDDDSASAESSGIDDD
ncbi:hypothetical protein C8J57DRAFT_1548468 [Mycena rebaudengoi]|nr:hypothetical protein C8J57DRAFT_1548468 [Mycena rebaudengoi]